MLTLLVHLLSASSNVAAHLVSPSFIPAQNEPFTAFSVVPYVEMEEPHDCIIELSSTNPNGPLIPCSTLPDEFVICDKVPQTSLSSLPATVAGNSSGGVSGTCPHFGGQKWSEIAWVNVSCRALPCLECSGSRHFQRLAPCIKYTGHYFLSTLLYSIFMGVLAVDRFCLGYSAIAVGKLMTLGGLGVWWIIDIFLLVTGNLMPADESNWEPFY